MSEKQIDITAHQAVGRAIDELRRQGGVRIDAPLPFALMPVESLDAPLLEQLRSLTGSALQLIVTGARARMIGLSVQGAAIAIDAHSLSLEQLRAIADPLAQAMSYVPIIQPASTAQAQALTLSKYASLLPALLIVQGQQESLRAWPVLRLTDLERYLAAPLLDIVQTAQAALPLQGAEHTSLISFRARYGTSVHLALVVGEPTKQEAPLVRIHSSCVTGDILGSLRCDCGDQLRMALDAIITEGSGLLIYLHQEGRGIGITNKLRAYALQERGTDTYDANLMLGFEEDERDFSIAAAILKTLHMPRIRLLTNNPAKLARIEQHGITVTRRMPLVATPGNHNHGYLDAKAKKSGHLF